MAHNINSVIRGYSRQKEEEQAQSIAREIGLPYVNLVNYPFTGDVLGILPEEVVKTYSIIAFQRLGNTVKVATPFPFAPGLSEEMNTIGAKNNYTFEPYFCSETSIGSSITQYSQLVQVIKDNAARADKESPESFLKDISDLQGLGGVIKSISTTKLLEVILSGSLSFQATDIHFEPQAKDVRIRFRIDGDLVDITAIGNEAYRLLTSRIKNLAGLKLNRLTSAQDGRFSFIIEKKPVDVRVSILPASYGETIELRLLSPQGLLEFNSLGIEPATRSAIERAISKPNGLIIITGPTGSGKTTTLYAILQLLNTPERKIITIEDPVEYKISGIEQIQIDSSKGFDFPEALRSVLRQDPDVILVGEIRDKETAEIAISASLTGHLVLTTLHSNSAAATFARLLELGAPPNLIADSVTLVIAQRLVKRAAQPDSGHWVARGRCMVTEFLEPNIEIARLIKNKASISEFEQAFSTVGNKTLEEDLKQKIAQGIVDPSEHL